MKKTTQCCEVRVHFSPKSPCTINRMFISSFIFTISIIVPRVKRFVGPLAFNIKLTLCFNNLCQGSFSVKILSS